MIQIPLQINANHKTLAPWTNEAWNDLKDSYSENQVVVAKITGTNKTKSHGRNAKLHILFKEIAEQYNHNLNSIDKVKFYVKVKIHLYKHRMEIDGVEYVELDSFKSLGKMPNKKADEVYTQAINCCAELLGVEPETLGAERGKEGKS